MTFFQALVLGLVQGVTEFLPISSSAHLILVSWLFGWPDQGLHFDMAAHTGSLAAVLLYLRRELAGLARGMGGVFRGGSSGGEEGRLGWGLAAATLPVAAAGWLFQDLVAAAGRRAGLIAATSILFGLLLGWAELAGRGQRALGELGWSGLLAVGLAQALAIVPGTSRSGVTITAALFLGVERVDAARLSFLLAVPVGLLVAAKDAADLAGGSIPAGDWSGMAVGAVAAGISAFVAMGALLAWLRRRGLWIFVAYRVALGLAVWGLLAGA